jgi:small subunit ribosomal protein S8
MSQDIISDALNQMMNAKKVEKNEVFVRKSKLLLKLLEIMKQEGHIEYEEKDKGIFIKIIRLNECKAIKPRYYVRVPRIEKYLRRFMISRKFGKLIISTNKGLLDQHQAKENNLGGSLIAYFY